jgi:hypothetical protein
LPVGPPAPPVFVPAPAPGLGYGGAEYGYSPYGSGAFPRQPVSPDGGYGGAPYGEASYGSVDIYPPRVSSAISLDGYRIEVFFSESMEVNTALCDAASYTTTPTLGAPATVTGVLLGTPAGDGGYSSVIIIHTGTTTGGTYTVIVSGPNDLAGNPVGPPGGDRTVLRTLGDTATYEVTAPAGDTLLFSFFRSNGTTPQNMLTEAGFSPGIEDESNYQITTAYPINLGIENINHPVGPDFSKAQAAVSAMTSAPYVAVVSPADAIIYNGSILPSAATTFTGTEIGTGISTASPGTKLLLSKPVGVTYGWNFADTSGKLLPGSSYRLAFTFNAAVATFLPPLFNTVAGTLRFSDGTIEVIILLNRVAGVDTIDVLSGAFSASIPASWSSGPTTIELYRNQKAGHFAVLINNVPVVSTLVASFTGIPTIPPGARFLLAAVYAVSVFKITGLTITSSSTVFTTAWNFLHSISEAFTGSPALANDRILTARGPLVKDWGDATPATEQDVEVRINSIPVVVDRVNPYTGTIFPAIPIPLTPPGSNTIEVDYIWFPAPVMEMAGLNTAGLILNKWDLPNGHHEPSVSPTPATSKGAPDTARFPMGVVLPPFDRPKPILIGHRYLGFEQDYTASLNSPTTLLLNQNPHRVSVPDLSKDVVGAFAVFDGTTTPPSSGTPWTLSGTDNGFVVGDGTYRLVDDQAGSYAVGEATVYFREENLACPVVVNQVARFKVENYVPDGVYTGVGFGFHDNFRLYLMGALLVNGVRHIGLLTDATQPHIVASWELGPTAVGTITDEDTITFPSGSIPGFVGPGARFQILEGPQTGVYTIVACGVDDYQGVITITVTPEFPADPDLEGNNTATVIFEVLWDTIIQTYRLIVDVNDRKAQLFVGGTLTGNPITVIDTAAIPADTSLLIPTGDKGRLMFGSFSRIATNSTTWSFHRYDVIPELATVHVRGIVVAAEMSDPPEDDANNEWFFTNRFGFSEIDATNDALLLKSTSADATGILDLTYGYARIEPLLTREVFIDVDATFKVETGNLGNGDAIVRVRDDLREVKLANILYAEGGTPFRRLVSLPQASLSGLLVPASDGWEEAPSGPPFTLTDITARENIVTIVQNAGETGVYRKILTPNVYDSGGRIFDVRLRVLSWTANAFGFAGPAFFIVVGLDPNERNLILALKEAVGVNPPKLSVLNNSLTEITSFPFTWTDGAFHIIRAVATATTVTLVADDTVLGTLATASLSASGAQGELGFGFPFSTTTATVEWDSVYGHPLPVATVKRTLGVHKGGEGDPNHIDSWALPRTDGTAALNSTAAAVVEEMDWRSYMDVRVHLDPTWGVSIYRPDLPPPPYFTGDFATQVTDPTAAWINIEYRRLPRHGDMFGSVAFGAIDPRSVTQQRWEEVRYRIYNTPDESFISPHHMVLNQYNVIHSGELLRDVTPEIVTVLSLTPQLVSIRSAHMNADRVFIVVVDNVVLAPSAWSFDRDTQVITLNSSLPSTGYPVTITFAPGRPVTNTYLCSQPIEDSVTLLNEGTPPVPASQQAVTIRTEVFGSQINDPSDLLNDDPDFILNDPYRTVEFEQGAESIYDCLSFCTVDDGGATGLLSIACDGPAPEEGFIEIGLEGRSYWNGFTVPGGPGGPWGSSSPSISGSASTFDQTHIFHLSGGNYTGPVLGPAGNSPRSVFYPNYPGPNGPQRGQRTGIEQEIQTFALLYTIPFEDDATIPETADNTPPTEVGLADPNPDGTPGVNLHGAAIAELVDGASAGYSRLGPWGGLASLSTNSLLAGGAPLDGTEFILNGGAPVGSPTVTTFVIEAAN